MTTDQLVALFTKFCGSVPKSKHLEVLLNMWDQNVINEDQYKILIRRALQNHAPLSGTSNDTPNNGNSPYYWSDNNSEIISRGTIGAYSSFGFGRSPFCK
jgi:hypothetical protein